MENIDLSIIQSMKFDLVVPLDPASCFNDIKNCETRNWGVPGEMLYFFILASPSILQLDSLSFSVFISKKQILSRRSTLIYPIATDDENKYIEPFKTKSLHNFPTNKPFRLPDGYAVYPLSVKIPINMTSTFTVEVFIPRKTDPVSKIELRSFSPLSVTVHQYQTTVSVVTQFNVTTSLKNSKVKEIGLEATDVMFNSQHHNAPNSNNINDFNNNDDSNPNLDLKNNNKSNKNEINRKEDDFLSNIKINKPCTLSSKVKDDQSLSVVFSFAPLSEIGAVMLSNLNLHFLITWSFQKLRFTTVWEAQLKNPSFGLALLIPPITAKLMKTTNIPLRITNMRERRENIVLVFEGGAIQPVAQRIKLPELLTNSSITVNVSVLPLAVGCHRFAFWAEENGVKINPLFPTYITVVE